MYEALIGGQQVPLRTYGVRPTQSPNLAHLNEIRRAWPQRIYRLLLVSNDFPRDPA
jgi:hypothetical protein